MTCEEQIIARLQFSPSRLAVHEFNLSGYSENNIATRLPEMAKKGLVIGTFRKGENFKEWGLVKVDKNGQLIFL